MLITEDIFQAFLKCGTKSHLKLFSAVGDQREFGDWNQRLVEDYKREFYAQLRSQYQDDELLSRVTFDQALSNSKCRLVIDCVVQTAEFQSNIHILERAPFSNMASQNPYIPVRIFPREKLTLQDRLLLAFDAHVLSRASGKTTLFGKIIYGRGHSIAKVKFDELLKIVEMVVGKIEAQHAIQTIPQLVLNKHCPECEFQARCRQVAIEKDNLSLLAGMTEKEIKTQQSKGIFSVTQLSYTFRPRRRPKRCSAKPEKYYHALKALAIRERKIHIAGKPELKIQGTPVYIDVEGIPDRNFYYLIGLRFWRGIGPVQYSFWANVASEEENIWAAFLQMLMEIENPQLVHYGSYERVFLKRMKERYSDALENLAFLDHLIAESVNVLSAIYAHIYFPTYSNGLKDIAQFLGFQWSEIDASGLKALRWRSEWEFSRDTSLKQRLITYNAEDCEALETVAHTVEQLCQRQPEQAKSPDGEIVHTDTIKRDSPYRFGKNTFSIPELEYINKAAYWDYQRDKIYVRTSPRLKRVSKNNPRSRAKTFFVNKVVEEEIVSARCPHCKAIGASKHQRTDKTVYDLKFGKAGIKRWIVKYVFYRYLCQHCGATFTPRPGARDKQKFGLGLLAYIVYQCIELRLPQETVARSINQLFGLNLGRGLVLRQKARASQLYRETYDGLLKKIAAGRLIHADETKITIEGKDTYVWVFTSLEEVVYRYTETREGSFLQELLRGFKGVLVSDFYTAYDSIGCPQQKCLVHLIRDLNDDLLEQPFNQELKEVTREFAMLLKPIIETVDRFGLRVRFLRKHKTFVERFYKELAKREYYTETAVYYKKRFEKNRDTLFTFLDYDGIPWNNNNAEHAIKSFASLRNVIGTGSSEKGIRNYLTLLSICETCRYKGVSFLDFLRSGEKDIDEFISRGGREQK